MKRTILGVFDDLGIGVTLHDPETGAVVGVNSRLEELSGYSESELREMTVADYSATDEGFTQANAEVRLERAATSEPQQFEWRIKRADGERRWVRVRLAVTELDSSEYVIAEIQDISEHKQHEQELAVKNQAIEQAPVGITLTDPTQPDNPLVYANKAFTDLIGYSPLEVDGWNHRELQGLETAESAIEKFRTAIDTEDSTRVEIRNYRKDGTMFWNNVSLAPLRDDSETVTNWVGFQEDITDRKQREGSLSELHTATQQLMQATTSQEVAEIASQTAEDVLGFSANAVNFYDETESGLIPVAVSEATTELIGSPPVLDSGLALEAFEAGETRIECDLSEAEAVYNPETELRSEMFVPFGSYGVLIVASQTVDAFDETDLSLAKILAANIESTLDRAEKHRQYKRLTDRISDAYYAVDADHNITYWNDVAADRFEAPSEDVIGESIWQCFPNLEGTVVEETFQEAMETQQPTACEYYYEPSDYWTSLRMYPDENGLAVISKDITEPKRREAELERSNERLQEFAYILSHDLQEPLRMVSSYVELLEMELEEHLEEETREYMAFAVDGADRMRGMIDGLLEYSRVETDGKEFDNTEMNAVVDQVTNSLQLALDDAEAGLSVGTLPTIEADEDQLGQLFQNLISNAIDHGGHGVSIEITAESTPEGCQVTVSDDGPGIPANRQDEIFGLFDKGTDSDGTGIGMAICERIVNRHNGEIWIDSSDGEGTIVTFTIQTSVG